MSVASHLNLIPVWQLSIVPFCIISSSNQLANSNRVLPMAVMGPFCNSYFVMDPFCNSYFVSYSQSRNAAWIAAFHPCICIFCTKQVGIYMQSPMSIRYYNIHILLMFRPKGFAQWAQKIHGFKGYSKSCCSVTVIIMAET